MLSFNSWWISQILCIPMFFKCFSKFPITICRTKVVYIVTNCVCTGHNKYYLHSKMYCGVSILFFKTPVMTYLVNSLHGKIIIYSIQNTLCSLEYMRWIMLRGKEKKRKEKTVPTQHILLLTVWATIMSLTVILQPNFTIFHPNILNQLLTFSFWNMEYRPIIRHPEPFKFLLLM